MSYSCIPFHRFAGMKNSLCLLFALWLCTAPAAASTTDLESGWAAWFNTTKFNERWGLASDVQLRSSDQWDEVQNVLLRPGLSYFIDAHNNLTFGYAWIGTLNAPSGDLVEHRIWQQYVHTQPLGPAALTHRLRLEQRFVEPADGSDRRFSQRLRYFLRVMLPLQSRPHAAFEHGWFAAMQNELFFNVQHRDAVNGASFDQNRAYLAVGYRVSTRLDLELGYLNQYVNGRSGDTLNHVVQLALYTRF